MPDEPQPTQTDLVGAAGAPRSPSPSVEEGRFPAGTTLALVGGGAAAWLLKPSLAPRPGPLGRFVITTGAPGVAIAINNRNIAITLDGTAPVTRSRFLLMAPGSEAPRGADTRRHVNRLGEHPCVRTPVRVFSRPR